ncbi:MAG: hypothetical protein H3C47_12880 [Candidatus Cloacimonetes bacterium]|nr:hypothetical protein [Candidatus Cloacimonadota bacterium]
MVRPEHREDCDFITRSIWQHELSTKKVYNEQDLVRDFYRIKIKIEAIYDGIDINKLVSSGIF